MIPGKGAKAGESVIHLECTNISFAPSMGGQALLEGLVGLALLAVIFWAIPVVGRYQDIALQTAHASRHAAFLMAQGATRQADVSASAGKAGFAEKDRRWRTLSGAALMPAQPTLSTQRVGDVAAGHPGAHHATVSALRREWRVGDEGILRASFTAQPADVVSSSAMGRFLAIERSTSILTGAGHAESDSAAQDRVAQGRTGWLRAAQLSISAGREIAHRMQGVDQAWGRSPPQFDWLRAWEGLVPSDRLARQP